MLELLVLHLTLFLRQPAPTPSTEPAATAAEGKVSKADAERAEECSKDGWDLWKKRDLEGAADRFQQAVELDPNNTNAWNGLGWSRFHSGDFNAAKIAFQRCIELQPTHPAALTGLGQLALAPGNLKEPEPYLLKAAQANASAAWAGLGQLYLLQEKWADAEKWLQKLADAPDAGPKEWVNQLLQAAKDKKLDDNLK